MKKILDLFASPALHLSFFDLLVLRINLSNDHPEWIRIKIWRLSLGVDLLHHRDWEGKRVVVSPIFYVKWLSKDEHAMARSMWHQEKETLLQRCHIEERLGLNESEE